MEYLNIFEKLKLLFSLISNNYLFIILFILFIGLFIVNKLKLISNKKVVLVIILSFVMSFSIILFFNSEALFKTFDSISNLIFKNIYFPSFYVYIAIILITDVIFVLSLISRNIDKIYKNINFSVSLIINFLSLMLIDVIGNDKIDILSTTSLFTNNYVVALVELITGLFIIWMVALFIIAFINYMTSIIDSKSFNESPVNVIDNSLNMVEIDAGDSESLSIDDNKLVACPVTDNSLEVDVSNISDPVYENISLSNDNKRIGFNDFVKKENNMLTEIKRQDNDISVLMNVKPIMPSSENVVSVKNNVDNVEKLDKYTKEDYKLFNDILNTVKETSHSKVITMDDALNINLLNRFSLQQYNLYRKMLRDISEKKVML